MSVNRREAIVAGVAALGLLAREGRAQADAKKPADVRATLLSALAECRRAGELCVAHCASELGQGNKEMANCNVKVHDMLALTQALATLASLGSPLAKEQAAICASACKACKEACAEHKAHFAHGMHLACRDCMEACETCETACRAFAAA